MPGVHREVRTGGQSRSDVALQLGVVAADGQLEGDAAGGVDVGAEAGPERRAAAGGAGVGQPRRPGGAAAAAGTTVRTSVGPTARGGGGRGRGAAAGPGRDGGRGGGAEVLHDRGGQRGDVALAGARQRSAEHGGDDQAEAGGGRGAAGHDGAAEPAERPQRLQDRRERDDGAERQLAAAQGVLAAQRLAAAGQQRAHGRLGQAVPLADLVVGQALDLAGPDDAGLARRQRLQRLERRPGLGPGHDDVGGVAADAGALGDLGHRHPAAPHPQPVDDQALGDDGGPGGGGVLVRELVPVRVRPQERLLRDLLRLARVAEAALDQPAQAEPVLHDEVVVPGGGQRADGPAGPARDGELRGGHSGGSTREVRSLPRRV